MKPTVRIPGATYRLQLNGQFRFDDARSLAPYLDRLGVTDLYTSPILQARRGSTHGYDVTDPTRLNPEIGSQEEFQWLVEELRRLDMGLLLDIVPNHMAASIENPWWSDVLENGPGSAYAAYFDIDWHPPNKALDNKVLLPLLGRRYADVLEGQQLKLSLEEHGFFLGYEDAQLPIAPKSYARILGYRLDDLRRELGAESPDFLELGGILAAVADLPERIALPSEIAGARRQRGQEIKERLWRLYGWSASIRTFLDENLRLFNGKKRQPASFVLLDELLSEQAYVLSFWQAGNEEINYRRFFTIADLVGVRVEDPLVFDQTHSAILRLAEAGAITGLRIDHVDGLRDPFGYLRHLQERLAPGQPEPAQPGYYIVVEKILSSGERMPAGWLASGTTGYDFLNLLNGLFVDENGRRAILDAYHCSVPGAPEYDELVYEKKKQVMETLLAVETRSLGHHLSLLAGQDRYARDFPRSGLTETLIAVTACLRVYRTYTRSFEMPPAGRASIEDAVQAARKRNPGIAPEWLDFLQDVLSLRQRPYLSSGQREARLDFVMRWQQFSTTAMAKGFEDTALYIYNPLVSLNEVGSAFSSTVSLEAFHLFCRDRQVHWPHSLNATSTHDTKRSEDVRARINVLSELPSEWEQHLRNWTRWNSSRKTVVNGRAVPDPSEEILLYQTMLGAWPFHKADVPLFRKRLQSYMTKAAREAMVHTKWTRPNINREKALSRFIGAVTKESGANRFLADFHSLLRRISYHGALNALAQLAVKIAAPGVPDFYQGSELWDLRLVDPDNRGQIDFGTRIRLLDELNEEERNRGPEMLSDLLEHWQDGRVKLYLVTKGLNFRKTHARLFQDGAYIPLRAAEPKQENVCAFARHTGDSWAITVAPRLTTQLTTCEIPPLGEAVWGKAVLELPPQAPRAWRNILTGDTLHTTTARRVPVLPLSEVLRCFPLALLENAQNA